MKRNTPLLLLLICAGCAYPQSEALNSFQEKYKHERDVTFINIDGSLVNLAGELASLDEGKDDEIRSFSRLSKGVDHISIMKFDHYEHILSSEEIESFNKELSAEGYEELMNIRQEGKKVKVLSQTGDVNTLTNVIIMVEEYRDLAIINIDGEFNLQDVVTLVEG
ncbi:MAG: DUF4252 domain-containing protein [Cyclobacteriaceae bacterium]|nr:DUF4252 domain-containing protein [Cyclobacteriaceae bacterium]